jgi:hypothetical protein
MDNKITKNDIDAFEKGTLTLEAMTPEKRGQLERIIAGEDVEVEGIETEAQPGSANQNPPAEDKPDSGSVPGDKYREKANEANTYKQRFEAEKTRLEKLTSELESLRANATPANSGNLGAGASELLERINRLESMVSEGNKKAIEKQESLIGELKLKMAFAEVDSLGEEYKELNLGTTFEKANKDYADFVAKLGGDLANVDKYLADSAYRASVEAQGIKIPKNFDKLQTVLDVYNNRDKYPSMEEAYLGHLVRNKKLKERFSSAYSKGVSDAVDRIADNKNDSTLLAPSGSGGSSAAMTEEQMSTWLANNPFPRSTEEKAVMNQIQSYLEAKSR